MIGIYSFPSSGRTWLKIMLDDLEIDGLIDHGKREETSYNACQQMFCATPFVYLMRNPYDTFISQYQKSSSKWKYKTHPLIELSRVRLDEFVYGNARKHKQYLNNGKTLDLYVNLFEDILIHHISALKYTMASDFILLHYEDLIGKNGINEFHKIIPHINKNKIEKVWHDNTLERLVQKSENKEFFDTYKLEKKFHGGGSRYRDFLTEEHLSYFSKLIDKHDYENKMKELYDVVS